MCDIGLISDSVVSKGTVDLDGGKSAGENSMGLVCSALLHSLMIMIEALFWVSARDWYDIGCKALRAPVPDGEWIASKMFVFNDVLVKIEY